MANKYIYYQYEDISYQSKIKNFAWENEWLAICPNGTLVVKASKEKPYAWNGNSPKFYLGDIYLGTPEGISHPDTGWPLTKRASLFHDALYQFCPNIGNGIIITRKECDLVFRDILIADGFSQVKLYYNAVRSLGWLWWKYINEN